MPEVLGIDHLFVSASELSRSETFYDVVMQALEFRKSEFEFSGERHIQYYNRHFGLVLRPARSAGDHDPYRAGLHHLCFRVESAAEVAELAQTLKIHQIETTEPNLYPEYAPDYVAVFFRDPDGIRLEVTNYRQERRDRHDKWNADS